MVSTFGPSLATTTSLPTASKDSIAEIEIGIFSRQCLGTRRIPDLKTLSRESRAWNRQMNRARTKINWTFDRKAARRKFGYKRNSFIRSQT